MFLLTVDKQAHFCILHHMFGKKEPKTPLEIGERVNYSVDGGVVFNATPLPTIFQKNTTGLSQIYVREYRRGNQSG